MLFDAPASDASQIAWVTGELWAFEKYHVFEVEVPLPLSTSGFRSSIGDLTVELCRFEEGSRPSATYALPFPACHSLAARIYKPSGVHLSSPSQTGFVAPILIGESGQPYEADGLPGDLCKAEEEMTEIQVAYTPREDRPTKILFQLVRKSNPEKLFSFRLTDIPLP